MLTVVESDFRSDVDDRVRGLEKKLFGLFDSHLIDIVGNGAIYLSLENPKKITFRNF